MGWEKTAAACACGHAAAVPRVARKALQQATRLLLTPPRFLVPSQIQSLKNLGLDITRADIGVEGRSAGKNRFFVTDAKTSDKIVLSERLEEIRATIIQNMLMYHPESRDSLAAGRRPGV